ncbi:unnamed protein product [Xylocopa violacea]|uniref:Protein-associating with the carboxyl-terminal domain of ezrin n=1 Tax=Xylocopa violacea TaxID=135666 RepID=A0ABP1P482_XYLVO
MGNEKSALSGLEIDEKPIEVTDFWAHHTAHVSGHSTQTISVYVSEPSLHYTANFGNPSPLEKAAKGNKFFLATEQVKPLIQSIETQNTLQICMGLYSILRALVFLHEKAFVSHNNICESSIYVTPEGYWKLGGLECLCKFKELTSYLKRIRNYRYEKAISSVEDTAIALTSFTSIDAYAFGILAENILKLKDPDYVPSFLEFKQFCKENLQNPDPTLRSELSHVLQHPFFTHDFMRIYAFLDELPLKSNQEKEIFFGTLITQLRTFPENIVAEQLGRLLLSRMVLLDTTAQEQLLPFILKPKENDNGTNGNLFTISTFKVYLVPKLLQMFCIRDVSIRLVLLLHFNSFVHTFQESELKSQVLPELLVGIKDTNDHLVSATLKALSDIVPILGAATVIGGRRGKLFTDGRPNKLKEKKKTDQNTNTVQFTISTNIIDKAINLPERPSPDGGEDKKEIGTSIIEEEYTWSDWDMQETGDTNLQNLKSPDKPSQSQSDDISTSITTDSVPSTDKIKSIESRFTKKLAVLSDISELDIKNSKSSNTLKEEYDFFTDMEPVIKKTQVLHVQQPQTLSNSVFDIKTQVGLETSEENNGWDEDLSDWGTEDAHEVKT